MSGRVSHLQKHTLQLLLLSACFLITEAAMRANADSTIAHCRLKGDTPSVPVETGPCRFSQRQGNVTILFRGRYYNFPYEQDGVLYHRSNSKTGIRFVRAGRFTLEVLWK